MRMFYMFLKIPENKMYKTILTCNERDALLYHFFLIHASIFVNRKPTICLGENKGADKLRSNCEAEQQAKIKAQTAKLIRAFVFAGTNSAIPLLP